MVGKESKFYYSFLEEFLYKTVNFEDEKFTGRL